MTLSRKLFVVAVFSAAAVGSIVAYGGFLMSRAGEAADVPPDTPASTRIASVNRHEPLAAESFRQFIAENSSSKSPEVRDQVGGARIRLAYLAANTKDFKSARQELLKAATVKGSEAMHPDYGSVPDQAAYQAAVCLAAEGKEGEAKREFERFITERPLSPLVHGAHRRLARLNDGESTPKWDQLLQDAIAKQEQRIRFETSVCGPKAIAHLLPMLGKPARDYKEIAKLCGTTDSGTTVEGLRKGLEKLGIKSWAFLLNRRDLANAPLPAILLEGDHYVVLKHVGPDKARVYDPRFGRELEIQLPPENDKSFAVATVLFSQFEAHP